MTPGEAFDPETLTAIEERWLSLCRHVADEVEWFTKMDVHKQWANRPLEFFGYIDLVLSSTNFANFLALRDHPAAQQEMQDLAKCIRAEMDASAPRLLKPGEWHLPYIAEADLAEVWSRWRNPDGNDYQYIHQPDGYWAELKKLSAARCARVSIAPFDGDASYEAEFRRYELLVGSVPVHASPTEHQATPDVFRERVRRKGETRERRGYYEHPELHGNLVGWIQNRKTIPGECIYEETAEGHTLV
jgi:hypothetical protein